MPEPSQPNPSVHHSPDPDKPEPTLAAPVDLSSESVAGEEDPGAAMDTTMKRDPLRPATPTDQPTQRPAPGQGSTPPTGDAPWP